MQAAHSGEGYDTEIELTNDLSGNDSGWKSTPCDVCGNDFENEKSLYDHKNTKHSQENNDANDEMLLTEVEVDETDQSSWSLNSTDQYTDQYNEEELELIRNHEMIISND